MTSQMNGNPTESLGTFLKRARTAIPLSLRAVEERTEDLTNGYLSQIEGDRIKRPSPNVLFQLSELYGLDYGDLLKRAGHRVPSNAAGTPSRDQLGGIPLRALADLSDEERTELTKYIGWLKSQRAT